MHFVDRLVETPGEPSTAAELLALGWPGEQIGASSATNRLYVAIAKLRRLGLGDLLASRFEGYLIPPDVELERVSESMPDGGHEGSRRR